MGIRTHDVDQTRRVWPLVSVFCTVGLTVMPLPRGGAHWEIILLQEWGTWELLERRSRKDLNTLQTHTGKMASLIGAEGIFYED